MEQLQQHQLALLARKAVLRDQLDEVEKAIAIVAGQIEGFKAGSAPKPEAQPEG